MMENDIAKAEFDTAVAVARHALEEFRKAPLVPAKRGGDRLSSDPKAALETLQP